MEHKDNGGPAFPQIKKEWVPNDLGGGYVLTEQIGGMSLRDYAVIQYTAAMLAHSTRYKPRAEDAQLHWHKAIAKEAGDLADTMIAERKD